MTTPLTSLTRWRENPCAFIEECLVDFETKKPFVLLPAEREFIKHAFKTDEDGRLIYRELLYSCPKKGGKTGFAAIFTLTLIFLFAGSYPEAVCASNDLEQSIGRVFTAIRRIIECSPMLRSEARITQSKITFPSINATITAIGADYAGAAGGNQNIAVFDEAWAYTSEKARRLWDELIPPPTRKVACRLTVTYAGFEGESGVLEELYQRGLKLPEVGTDLRAGDGLLMFWSHVPIAPWQDEKWLAEMRRTLRPNQYLRMIENRFVSSESNFVDMPAWDACVQPALTPVSQDRRIHIWVGVDASVKRDSTALVGVTFDKKSKTVRLVTHKAFTPRPGDPINFEQTVETTLLDWHKRFALRKVWFDPYQLVAVAQRLTKAHINIEEYPQTIPNLTAATSCLFDLVQNRSLILYPDNAMRLAISRAIIVESSRGWRLDKMKQSHKIDIIVALSMACLAAVRGQEEPFYDPWSAEWDAAWGNAGDLGAQPKQPHVQQEADRHYAELLARFGQPGRLGG
jgi:phage terminase large subunit-like protein